MSELHEVDPRDDKVWGGIEVSMGISSILSTLAKLSNQPRKPAWTLYLINVSTIIRNRINGLKVNDKEEDPVKVAKETISDCTILAQYIAAYSRLAIPPQFNQNVVVCFYLPDYTHIPKEYLRDKLKPHTAWIFKVQDHVKDIIRKEKWTSSYENTDVIFCAINGAQWPHKSLFSDLQRFKKDIAYHKCLLVSHVPLDFHLYRQFKDFTLLESFTGNLRIPKQFGHKVWKEDFIPFNKYTHLTIGDSVYIRDQLDRKQKKIFKETAKMQHWNLLPDKQVLEAIIRLGIIPNPHLLIDPNI